MIIFWMFLIYFVNFILCICQIPSFVYISKLSNRKYLSVSFEFQTLVDLKVDLKRSNQFKENDQIKVVEGNCQGTLLLLIYVLAGTRHFDVPYNFVPYGT